MTGLISAIKGGLLSLAQTLLGLVAGVCVLSASVALFGDRGLWNWLNVILLSPVFGFAAVLVHEIGHAAAAWRCKWIVERIVVWPVSYAPVKKKWSWARHMYGGGDMFGWVMAHPRAGKGTTRQEVFFTLGGVLANLICAVVCIVLAQVMKFYIVNALLWSFGVLSLVVAISNLLPWKIAGQPSDGLQLWRISRFTKRIRTPSKWNEPRKF